MQIILEKCKCVEIEASKQIIFLENAFLNAQQMPIQQVIHICLSSHNIIQQDLSNL
jgi:hypothetical protein